MQCGQGKRKDRRESGRKEREANTEEKQGTGKEEESRRHTT